jgi:hypothetical protein
VKDHGRKIGHIPVNLVCTDETRDYFAAPGYNDLLSFVTCVVSDYSTTSGKLFVCDWLMLGKYEYEHSFEGTAEIAQTGHKYHVVVSVIATALMIVRVIEICSALF